ncbi:MAG: DUF429 domain-containing protein [Planctomycetota bacterium]
MAIDREPRFVGVDGTQGRWVAIAIDARGEYASAGLFDSLDEMVAAHSGAECLAIDVPIGLLDAGVRAADAEAKRRLGRRGSTVFLTPTRAVIEAPSYDEAARIARASTGKGIARQSYALRTNILAADALRSDARIHEVHPELAFAALAGRVLQSKKRSWRGACERRELLERAGLCVPSDIGVAGDVPVDDVLDAAVCAWSARRIAEGAAEHVPDEPELDETGRPIAIWF